MDLAWIEYELILAELCRDTCYNFETIQRRNLIRLSDFFSEWSQNIITSAYGIMQVRKSIHNHLLYKFVITHYGLHMFPNSAISPQINPNSLISSLQLLIKDLNLPALTLKSVNCGESEGCVLRDSL